MLLPAAGADAQVVPRPEGPGETYTPQQAFASPTVTVGGKVVSRLCELGVTDASPPSPGAVEDVVPRRPCSEQRVQRLRLGRARYARVALQAPADRVLAGWYEGAALRPSSPVQTGAQQWDITLPATSGRLVLNVIFEINITAVPYDLRIDWKLSIRRSGPARPAPTVPVAPVPVDDGGRR